MNAFAPEQLERAAQLTRKEQACLELVSQHLSSKQIAAELGIAKTSVDTYCNRARVKLGVTDRYAAARILRALRPARAAPRSNSRQARFHPASRLLAICAVGMVLFVAFATLLAGLRALEVMKPPWPGSTAGPTKDESGR